MQRRSRRLLIIASLLAALLLGAFAAFQFAAQSLKTQVEQALGPQGEVHDIRVGLTGLEIADVRIRAAAGTSSRWPSEDELRARRILITPSLVDLLTARLVIDSIRIEGAYISMLRGRNGQMQVLPSLLARQSQPEKTSANGQAAGNSGPQIVIGKITLADGTIEFFDASVRATPVKLRLEQIEARIGKLRLPGLTGQTALKIDGVLKGNRQDGRIAIDGSIELASKESGLTTKLRGVDMTVLQPYLIQAAETGVRRGTLDLDLNSSVSKGKLRAPGSLSLSDLELSSAAGTFMGVPRSAAIGLLKDKKGKISVQFVLEGDINDPRFSLNEQFASRLGTSLAGTLGISIESLAKGVGSVGGGAAKSIGESLGKLLGK